jgi:hypothetical protein
VKLWIVAPESDPEAGERDVHDVFQLARFDRLLDVDRTWPLRWGEPTRIHGMRVRGADLAALVAFLRERDEAFFVFPDFTILYALVGQEPPQPLLWFHRGLTYPEARDAALDRRIVAEIERRGVRTVVVERASWLGTKARLGDFPELRRLLDGRFTPVRRFGLFEVLER